MLPRNNPKCNGPFNTCPCPRDWYNLTSLNPASPPTFCDRRAISTALDFVSMQVTFEKAHWLTAKRTLHLPHAAVAEIQADITMTIVIFLSELIKPTVNEGRDAALLSAGQGVLGIHFQLTSEPATHQPSTSLHHLDA